MNPKSIRYLTSLDIETIENFEFIYQIRENFIDFKGVKSQCNHSKEISLKSSYHQSMSNSIDMLSESF
jgi:hypothetical protein